MDRRGGQVVRVNISESVDPRKYTLDTYEISDLDTLSVLRIGLLTSEDSGNYKCSVPADGGEFAVQGISVRFQGLGQCVDRPNFSHCDQVVKHKYCGNKYYGTFCCKSCTEAGMVPGTFS